MNSYTWIDPYTNLEWEHSYNFDSNGDTIHKYSIKHNGLIKMPEEKINDLLINNPLELNNESFIKYIARCYDELGHFPNDYYLEEDAYIHKILGCCHWCNESIKNCDYLIFEPLYFKFYLCPKDIKIPQDSVNILKRLACEIMNKNKIDYKIKLSKKKSQNDFKLLANWIEKEI